MSDIPEISWSRKSLFLPAKKYKVSSDKVELEVLNKTSETNNETNSLESGGWADNCNTAVNDFIQNTTFHGIRYIAVPGSLFRK